MGKMSEFIQVCLNGICITFCHKRKFCQLVIIDIGNNVNVTIFQKIWKNLIFNYRVFYWIEFCFSYIDIGLQNMRLQEHNPVPMEETVVSSSNIGGTPPSTPPCSPPPNSTTTPSDSNTTITTSTPNTTTAPNTTTVLTSPKPSSDFR